MLGDLGKIRSRYYVFKLTRKQNLNVCEDKELCACRDLAEKESTQVENQYENQRCYDKKQTDDTLIYNKSDWYFSKVV